MARSDPAARHRDFAATFAQLTHGVRDWDAPSPVEGWTARDVVGHLVGWLPGLLAAGNVTLRGRPAPADDPVAAWDSHASAVQALLDADDAERAFTHPMIGTLPLSNAIDNFYTTDVFMHTWDLARASSQASDLDEDECARLLAGMEPIEQMLRDSGSTARVWPCPTTRRPRTD